MDDKSTEEPYTDVAAKILAGRSYGGRDTNRVIRELEDKITHHKEMALASFAKVQLSIGDHFAVKSWPIAHLRDRVSLLDKHLEEIDRLESQVLVVMSPVMHEMGLGTGVTPAELEGARVRSEQANAERE
jgi:hypothetical protein